MKASSIKLCPQSKENNLKIFSNTVVVSRSFDLEILLGNYKIYMEHVKINEWV